VYEDMTYENILKGMMARVSNDLDKREGSIIHYALAPSAYCMTQTYFQLMNFVSLVYPDESAGMYLDNFAGMFGIVRKAATKAIKTGSFDVKVPIGNRFTAMGESTLIYAVTEYTGEESGVFLYRMKCETAGDIGNEYTGKLVPVEYISGLGSAELGEIVTVGTDEETDDALRIRLLAKMQKPSTSGNANDYYNWTMSVSGVGATKIFPLANGSGTVKVVITSEDKTGADAALVKAVYDYIESVRPIGADVSVVSAIEKMVNVSAKVKLTAGTNLGTAQDAFFNSTEGYLQGKAFGMDYISLARIGNLLLAIEGVEDYADLKLNGEAGNIAIADEEVAVIGTVRLEVM